MGFLSFFQESRDVGVELRRVLDEGEMADIGLDEEAGTRRPVGHFARLIVGDHLVVVGVGDPGRHGDLRESDFVQ